MQMTTAVVPMHSFTHAATIQTRFASQSQPFATAGYKKKKGGGAVMEAANRPEKKVH